MNILKKKLKNTDTCCVKNCGSNKNDNPELHFHYFPKPNLRFINKINFFGNIEKVDQCKSWQIALRLKTCNRHLKVCSLHFLKEDYFFPGTCK